jgi:hypothetical protein
MAARMTQIHINKLREQLLRVENAIRDLEGERKGLKLALSVMTDEIVDEDTSTAVTSRQRRLRTPLKETVLRMLSENAERGLVAIDIVDLAKANGQELDRNSVSSLLSRFKKDGVVEHRNGRYYLPAPFPREVKDAA